MPPLAALRAAVSPRRRARPRVEPWREAGCAGCARAGETNASLIEPFGFDDRPLSVNAAIGFGMPLGLVGAFVEYNPLPWFAAGAGGASMPKALPAFTLELGYALP